MKPVDLLKNKLNEYEKALQKSFESYRKKDIDLETHSTHKKNLNPLIFEYKRVIQILENWIE